MIPKSGYRFSDKIMPKQNSNRGPYVIVCGCAMRQGCGTAPTRSHQAEFAQLAAQLLGHRRCARCRLVKVARGVLHVEVAPALEGAERARRHQHDFGIEHDTAAPDAVLVAKRPDGADALAAHDLAADHPIERAAVGELVGALGHHAGAMDMLRLFAAFALVLELLLDPVLEIANRIGANAELDKIESHCSTLSLLGRFDHHDLCAFHNLLTRPDWNFGHGTRKRRAQRVLHLHRLNHGKTLAGGHAIPDRDVDLQHPAMHRRLDDAVAGAGFRSGDRKILDAHASLAAVAQHISLVVGLEHPGIGCRRRSLDGNAHAVRTIADRSDRALAIDRDRHGVRARSAELKAVAHRPWRARFGWLISRCVAIHNFTFGFTPEQLDDAERGGCGIRLVWYCAKRREVAVDEPGLDLALAEFACSGQSGEKGYVAPRSGDHGTIECGREPVQRGLARGRMRDELGDHRIIIRRDLAARLETSVDADVGWQFHRHDPAGRRQEAAFGVLGIDPRFDGVAVEADLRLFKRQLFAAGNTELPFDKIETRDGFGHRMFDLQPRVHLDEPERVGAQPFGAVGNELDRAGADITDGARRLDRG